LDQHPLARHTLCLIDQNQHKLSASFTTTLFTAVLNIFPIICPLLAPFKGQSASNTDLWREAIFNLCSHRAIVGVTTFELD